VIRATVRGVIRLRPLAVAGLTALVLAGCSNAETPAARPLPTTAATTEPSRTPEPVASATPSSTVTRNLPVPEPIPQEFSELGATGFASYYVKVLNYSRNSGDVELLRSISDAGCSRCDYDIREVQEMLDKGYSHVALETQFRATLNQTWDPSIGDSQMDVVVNRAEHTIVDSEGQELSRVPALEEATFSLWLRWVDDRWLVWEVE
jgi:hypothetical protein